MNNNEYSQYDALGLAQLIRQGDVSADEVQEAARRVLDQVNPKLNAIVGELFTDPLPYNASGSLAGVPTLLKDLGASAEGVPMGSGSRLLGDGLVQSQDSEIVARFKGAGLAFLGRTTTPEFGWSGTTEPLSTGPTRNPWDPSRSSGGSSGGSAALVAAGAVPIAHGNDGGGSIRIPAAWCGIIGMKPSRGRIADGPASDPSPDSQPFAVQFALTRTVRDTALLLDAVAGPGVGDFCSIGMPARPYREEIRTGPDSLRIAVADQAWSPRPVNEEHRATVQAVGRALEDMGHAVEEASPTFESEAALDAFARKWAVAIAYRIDKAAQTRGVDPESGLVEGSILASARVGRNVSGYDICAADAVLHFARRSIGVFFRDYDVLVTPTMTEPACPLGTISTDDPTLDPSQWQRRSLYYCPYAWPFNVTGQPAISLPLGETKSGLPIGVQFVARPGAEATLLKLAARLEEIMPWASRRPDIAGLS